VTPLSNAWFWLSSSGLASAFSIAESDLKLHLSSSFFILSSVISSSWSMISVQVFSSWISGETLIGSAGFSIRIPSFVTPLSNAWFWLSSSGLASAFSIAESDLKLHLSSSFFILSSVISSSWSMIFVQVFSSWISGKALIGSSGFSITASSFVTILSCA